MLCQACNNVLSRKSARWKGSYKATFESGDGGRQLTSTDSTTSEPEANSTDHPGLDDLGPEADSSDDADLDGLDPEANLSDNAGLEDSGPEADSSDDEGLNDEADESFDPLKPGGFVLWPGISGRRTRRLPTLPFPSFSAVAGAANCNRPGAGGHRHRLGRLRLRTWL